MTNLASYRDNIKVTSTGLVILTTFETMSLHENVSNMSENQCIQLSEKDAYLWLYSPLEVIIIVGILPCFGALGFFASLAFQIAVIRNPNLQSKTNYFLFSLAICDEIVIIGAVFVWFIGSYIASPVSYAIPFQNCWLISTCLNACVIGSYGLVTLVAFDRYLTLCHPITYRNKFTASATKKMIIGNAIISALFSSAYQRWGKNITLCVIWPDTGQYEDLPTTINTCGPACDFRYADILFLDIPFYISLILNIFMYAMIVRKISELGSISSGTNESNVVRKQVVRVLLANAVVFMLSQIPYRIISINDAKEFTSGMSFLDAEEQEKALLIGRMFLVLNSAVNPFIYGLASKFYRQEMKKVFCQRCQDWFKQNARNIWFSLPRTRDKRLWY